jgi:hypothetical protein
MTNLSSIAARFDTTSFYLREFGEAIQFLRKKGLQSDQEAVKNSLNKLLKVLEPIRQNFEGELSQSISIDEYSVIEILRQKHDRDWQQFKNRVSEMTLKISEGKTDLSVSEIDVLYEIADAVDMECAQLFKKISGRS